MLDFKGISVHYGHQDVLTDVTFRVNAGDRIGVVGPNGSGKSNISDAMRWVLGEISSRNIRGTKMEDVIFAGTAKRTQTGFCEV